jgi:ketosteroid isomerase-like protein
MDRMTAAMMSQDSAAMAACYAEDAVATAPDQSEIRGRDAIVSYLSQMAEAFPDARYEPLEQHEAGDVAIDQGYFTGTNTGHLQMPQGESLPPTGRQLRLRSCDVARVEGGLVVSHHFYWDQLDFMSQLGLLPEPGQETH